jgi:hypothetical protein
MGKEASIARIQCNLVHFVKTHGNYALAERLFIESMRMFEEHGEEAGVA